MSSQSGSAQNEANRLRLLAVVGPTASGKTALAVRLAQCFDGEVISCDSMQIYKNMPIATAAPSEDEQQGVPHHLIGVIEPMEKYSVALYCQNAARLVREITDRGNLPLLCGGTGLYYTSLVDGIAFSDVRELPELRKELEQRAQAEGGEGLLKELAAVDSETASRLAAADTRRIVRALEVYYASGITMSEHIRRSRARPSDYELCVIGLDYKDRKGLYDRINTRVDVMLEQGLLQEARSFFSSKHSTTAVQAIGYKELKPFLDGECSLEQAVEHLKMETRRYAKRQLTWFRRDDRVKWIYVDEYASFEEVAQQAEDFVKECLYG